MIIAENLCKSYSEKKVINDLSFVVPDKENALVLGESGTGKTTLFRLICSLEKPDSGRLYGYDRRSISCVFQDHRLFPWESALSNVLSPYGKEKEGRAKELLGRLELGEDMDKRPAELSGGMRARVSIARALLHDGSILLLDEPFSALDRRTKELAAEVIRDHIKGRTVLLISHGEDDHKLLFGKEELVKIRVRS